MSRRNRSCGRIPGYLAFMLCRRKRRFILPVAAGFLVLTAVCLYFRREYAGMGELYYRYVADWFNRIVPFFACFWTLGLLGDFLGGQGNELLYLYLRPGEILKVQLKAGGIYAALVGAYTFGLGEALGLTGFFAVVMCAEAVFVEGLAFALMALVRNMGVPYLLIMVYYLYLRPVYVWNIQQGIPFYENPQIPCADSIGQVAGLTLAAAVLYAVGYAGYRWYKSYDS